MFVMSVKGKTVKTVSIVAALAIVLTIAIMLIPDNNKVGAVSIFKGSDTYKYDKIKTNEKRLKFLNQFGWETEKDCVEEVEIKIPLDFDKVMNAYNEIQKAQGLDLSKYKGKPAKRYTYKITNFPDYEGTVFANIIIYKNRVIAGDICSSDVTGFIQGFEMPVNQSSLVY